MEALIKRVAGLTIACVVIVSCTPVPTTEEEPPPEQPDPSEIDVGAPSVNGLPDEDPPGAGSSSIKTAKPAWWMDDPNFGAHGFVATVQADGSSVTEARAAAIEEARAVVARHYGAARDDVSIEKTLITSPERGRYTAFVYVACAAPLTASAGADDTP
jgi:hypothetical protein